MKGISLIMGTRNRAFNSEVGDVEEEIPNISGRTQDHRDGAQLTKFVSFKSVNKQNETS